MGKESPINQKIPQTVTVGAKINVMNLERELQRLIKAANDVLGADEYCKQTRYSATPRESLKLKMYDLKKAVQQAETELKKKQSELF